VSFAFGPVTVFLFKNFHQVPDIDAASPSRVCDSCFQNIVGHQQGGRASAATHVRRSSVAREGLAGRGELSMADFDVVKHLGRGAFGQVLEVCALACPRHRQQLRPPPLAGQGEKDAKVVRSEGKIQTFELKRAVLLTIAADYGEKRVTQELQLQDAGAAGGCRKADHGRPPPPQRRAGVLRPSSCFRLLPRFSVFLTCSFLLHRKRVTHLPQLCHAFQSNSKLYMVIDLCPGGTL
jgi:hypothetical protein